MSSAPPRQQILLQLEQHLRPLLQQGSIRNLPPLQPATPIPLQTLRIQSILLPMPSVRTLTTTFLDETLWDKVEQLHRLPSRPMAPLLLPLNRVRRTSISRLGSGVDLSFQGGSSPLHLAPDQDWTDPDPALALVHKSGSRSPSELR